ncbi:3195_t:CDS:1, partial [Racocetra fulgida]
MPCECESQYLIMSSPDYISSRVKAKSVRTKSTRTKLKSKPILTEEECELLNNLIGKYGCRWSKISKHFPTKSLNSIESFVRKNPNKFSSIFKFPERLRKHRCWTDSEMKLLNNLIMKYGRNYDAISRRILGRTSEAVSRFLPRHSPDLPALRNANILRWFKSSSLWTERETRTLNDLVEQYGNDWFLISSKLYGRTAFACQDKFYACWQPNKIKKELVLHSWPQEAIRVLDYLISKYGRWQIIPILLPGTTPFNYYMRSATNIWGWRNHEISLLRDLIQKYGHDWKKIKAYLPHKRVNSIEHHVKTNPQLYNIEYHKNDTELYEIVQNLSVQKRWSADELRKLLELRSQYETDWCKISEGLPGRSPSACFYKYQVITRLLMKVGKDWHSSNIIQVQDFFQKYGPDWELISQNVSNKSPGEIQQLVNENPMFFSNPGFDRHFIDATRRTTAQPWSEEDILKLKNFTEIHGKDWNKIASQLPGKTSEDCEEYYNLYKDNFPNLNMNHMTISDDKAWTEKEKQSLKDLLEKYGTDYDRIARFIPGKSQESIRSYVNTHKQELLPKELDMYENESCTPPWTKDEENKLINLVILYRDEWKMISDYLPERSPIACKRKYYTILHPNFSKIEAIS